jgi:homogentisate 1,2-dioxygenase
VKGKGDVFYKNATCDEVLFVHKGRGTFESMLGTLTFGEGDYIIVRAA